MPIRPLVTCRPQLKHAFHCACTVMNAASSLIAQGILLSIAPVFMLAAVAAMINAVVGRLARIIDRGRKLENEIESGACRHPERARIEMRILRKRARIVNLAIALLSLCALLLCLTAGALFVTDKSYGRCTQTDEGQACAFDGSAFRVKY